MNMMNRSSHHAAKRMACLLSSRGRGSYVFTPYGRVLPICTDCVGPSGSSMHRWSDKINATTIICVQKNGRTVIAGDGQTTQGQMIVKANVRKVRKLSGGILVGYAGAVADALTLIERLEQRLENAPGQLLRSCVELAKTWRTDRFLRNLQATMIVADSEVALEVTGDGNVLEADEGILGIGSGSPYAIAAAKALYDIDGMEAKEIALKAMNVAAGMCTMTNNNISCEELGSRQNEALW